MKNPGMKNQTIVVANASLARLFRREWPRERLVALATLEHPESRLKGVALDDDRPGHEATDHSPGGNRFEPRSDARRKEHGRFAHEIAKRLDEMLAEPEFGTLCLCASAPFLGELKMALSEGARHRLQRTIDSDFTAFDLRELDKRLQEHTPA